MFEKEIKEALKQYNLDEGLWEKIKVEKVEQIAEAVRDFAIDFLAEQKAKKEIEKKQKEFDMEKERLLKIEREKMEKEFTERTKATQTVEKTKPEEMPVWMKPFLAQLDAQNKKLEEIEKKEAQKARKDLIRKYLNDAKLPDKLAINITADDEEGIKSQIDTFKQILNDHIAEINGDDNRVRSGIGDSVIDEIVQERNTGEVSSGFAGIDIRKYGE